MAAELQGCHGADCGGCGTVLHHNEGGVCGVAVEVGVEAAAASGVARRRILHY